MSYLDSFLFNLPLLYRSIVIALSIALVAALAYWKRQLTLSGCVAAIILGSGTLYILGFSGLSVYLFFLITAGVIGKLSKKVRGVEQIQKKGGNRDASQVFSNGAPAFIAALLYLATKNDAFLVVFVSCLAEACCDTWSGDIGVLSKKAPYSIITFTQVPPGQSGGVSVLGTFAGLLCSLLFGTLYISLFNFEAKGFFTVVISSFFGMILDSILGATIQVHYYDEKKDLITEREEVDGRKLPVYRGLKFFNNDRVNLTCNIFAFLLAMVFALLCN